MKKKNKENIHETQSLFLRDFPEGNAFMFYK